LRHVAPLLLAQIACLSTASAQTATEVEDPPLLAIERRAPLMLRAAPGEALPATPGEAVLDLDVTYVNGRLWNPSAQRFDSVKLRGYVGRGMNPNAPYVSPTLSVFPGETIRITLNNKLPADPTCKEGGDVNKPHCFNGTNLHTHGLWVNPAGNGDNVLISINPGVSFQYEYNIPPDHPAGTFWYHTHRHGSTAMQVSSGMAGAIVIRGTRPPTPTATGDIDTLLRPTPAQAFKERLLVLQQIQYACRDAQRKIKRDPPGKGPYKCDPGEVAGIEPGPPDDVYDLFGPGEWPSSGRFTTINGLVVPTFGAARAGQIERWRVIHGGVRDSINLQFRKLKPGAPSPAALKASEQDAYINAHCTGDVVPQHLAAADGLTLAKAIKSNVTVFQPAYRWDLLMVFPQSGNYCVIDTAAPAGAGVGQLPQSRQLLGLVAVASGSDVAGDISGYLAAQLAMAAARNMPGNVKAKVAADLRNGLVLASFVPHPDIRDNEITGKQALAFNIDTTRPAPLPALFQVNGKSFEPDRVDRVLMLGGVDEWTLKSDFVSHPFHIHVNPFQIVEIRDPNGKDVSAPGAVDDYGGTPDPQYPGLKGLWKDTLWVKNPSKQYTLIVRTRYQRYIGDYVLHCHILDHEDQGMMQRIRVALPDGSGGTSEGHH
jgi:FtsP/CotA-like multicopper oxidase with cupredoxin domain